MRKLPPQSVFRIGAEGGPGQFPLPQPAYSCPPGPPEHGGTDSEAAGGTQDLCYGSHAHTWAQTLWGPRRRDISRGGLRPFLEKVAVTTGLRTGEQSAYSADRSACNKSGSSPAGSPGAGGSLQKERTAPPRPPRDEAGGRSRPRTGPTAGRTSWAWGWPAGPGDLGQARPSRRGVRLLFGIQLGLGAPEPVARSASSRRPSPALGLKRQQGAPGRPRVPSGTSRGRSAASARHRPAPALPPLGISQVEVRPGGPLRSPRSRQPARGRGSQRSPAQARAGPGSHRARILAARRPRRRGDSEGTP